jgi:calcium-dependent protein kinase
MFTSKDPNASLKILDFGFAKMCEEGNSLKSRVGTPYYIAPEVLSGNYSKSCDVWSSGVILYILLSGCPPFYGNNDSELLRKVRSGAYTFPASKFKNVTETAKDLIRRMLVVNTKQRITMSEVLRHPWMSGNDAERSDFTMEASTLSNF